MKHSKSRLLALCLSVAMLLSLWPMTVMAADSPFAGGSGTEADPWLIANEAQLIGINGGSGGSNAYRLGNHHFKLVNDIQVTEAFNLNTRPWIFDGTFDGNGYTISGLRVSLFGQLEQYKQPDNIPITIKNLNLETAEGWAAGTAALFDKMGTHQSVAGSGNAALSFSNVHVTVKTISGTKLGVGLVGESGYSPVTIKGCSVTVESGARLEASGAGNAIVAGGLVKHIRANTAIENSFVHVKEGGRISAVSESADPANSYVMAGGLSGSFQGMASNTSTVKNCYVINEGRIAAEYKDRSGIANQGAGGLVGYTYANTGTPSVTNSYVYNSGSIESTDSTGVLPSRAGIVYGGWKSGTKNPSITGIYYNEDAACAEAGGGEHKDVAPLSLDAMKTPGSYSGWAINGPGSPWRHKAEQAPAQAANLKGLPYLIVEDNARLTPATGSFNKADLTPVVTTVVGGGELQSIYNGETRLTAGIDYTFNGKVLSIKTAYLTDLKNGATTLELTFSEGEKIHFTIIVADETPSHYTISLVNSEEQAGAPYINGRNESTVVVSAADAASAAFAFYAEPKEGYVLEKWVDGEQNLLAETDPYVRKSVTGSLQVIPVYRQVSAYVDISAVDKVADSPLEGAKLTLSETTEMAITVPRSGHVRRVLEPGTYSYILEKENYVSETGTIEVAGGKVERFTLSADPYYRGPYESADQSLSVTKIEEDIITVEYGISAIRAVSGELALSYDTEALTLLAGGGDATEGATPGAVAVPIDAVILTSSGAVDISAGTISLTWYADDTVSPRYVDALQEEKGLFVLKFRMNEGASATSQSLTGSGSVMANKTPGEEIDTKDLALTLQQTAAPVITPLGGVFAGSQQIQLSCETDGAVIYYTIDGSEPTASAGIRYQEPFTISGTVVVKAIAVKTGMSDSDVVEAAFTEEGDTKADITRLALTIGEETYAGQLTEQTDSGGAFTVTLPYGTDEEQLRSLTPEITVSTGASITPEGSQDFSSPVTYTVTSANGETEKTYTVTVVIALLAEHTVSAAPTSHGAVVINPALAVSGTAITVEAKPELGYELESLTWSVGDGQEIDITETGEFEMPDSDVTITAVFRAVTYSITYELDGGSKEDQLFYTVEDLPMTLTAPVKDGFIFTGWTYDGVSEPVLTVTLEAGTTGAKTFTANWTEDDRGVTVSGTVSSGGEENDPATVTLKQGETVVATTAAIGGTFSFDAVEAGEYTVEVSKEGHVTKTFELAVADAEITDLAYTIYLIGDVNEDSEINGQDLQRLYEHLNGSNLLSAMATGDLNKDGEANGQDLQRLYEHLNGSSPL